MTEIPQAAGGMAGAPEAASQRLRYWTLAFTEWRWAPWISFTAVVALSAVLNLWRLAGNGYGNTFYAAAARSATLSWKNWFFGSFDPGGFITVDKPPFFLWIGGLSARIFGYSSWSILAPSAIAGAATVALVWWIVRRYFGVAAATFAGIALALTPISVAVDRLNLPEPFYILALVGAAAAILRSLESRRWWIWVIVAGALVGVAFNTKMLAGWIPGPAMALALVIGDGDSWRRPAVKRILGRLALLAAATFVVSASWTLVADAWPASSRPYIGGSTNNTVSNLAFDYNGLGRVQGESFGRPGGGGGARPSGTRNFTPPSGTNRFTRGGGFTGQGGGTNRFVPGTGSTGGTGGTNGAGGSNGFTPPNGNTGGSGFPSGNAPNPAARGGGARNATGAGGVIAGSPGWLRMFDDANGGQIGWLLPFALLGSLLCFWYWRRDRKRRAATVLFLGWVVLFGGVFSYAQGTYHSYYTSALAPGIAALVGMTVIASAGLLKQSRWWLTAIGAIAAVTAWVQIDISGRFPGFESGVRPWAVAAVAIGALIVVGSVFALRRLRPTADNLLWRRTGLVMPGLSVMMAGLLLIPAAWSGYEATHPSTNTTLPQAGPRQGLAGQTFGSAAFDDGASSLAAWLQAHRKAGTRWDLAVSSAQNASTLIAQYKLSVMAIGGFLGTDPTITASQFADYVEKGEVQYVLVSGGGFGGFGGFGGAFGLRNFGGAGGAQTASTAKGASAVMSAVESACTEVTATDLPSQDQGSLYDCAGAAAKLRTAG